MSTEDTQLQIFDGHRCATAELAITGTIPLDLAEKLRLGEEVGIEVTIQGEATPVTAKVSQRRWTRKVDKDSEQVFVIPRVTIALDADS